MSRPVSLLLLLVCLLLAPTAQAAVVEDSAGSGETPGPVKTGRAIVVGSYYGYWGLNDWFMGLLGQYFTMEQMRSIDRQIQEIAGIDRYYYNYNCESGSGYYYDSAAGRWTYGGGRAGKHYGELVDKAFWIDVDTARVIQVTSSRSFEADYYRGFGNSPYVGKDVQIGDTAYRVLGARNWSPIVLDLDGDGEIDVARRQWLPHAPAFYTDRTGWFDLTGDRVPEYCEWIGPRDGLLVLPQEDGRVVGAENLFGTAGGYRDGYEKMSVVLDRDGNGWVEGQELAGLKVWVDANGDAVADPAEMKPLSAYQVERIRVEHENFVSVYLRGGSQMKVWDWWPSGFELSEVPGR
jgi:hypothetical protein